MWIVTSRSWRSKPEITNRLIVEGDWRSTGGQHETRRVRSGRPNVPSCCPFDGGDCCALSFPVDIFNCARQCHANETVIQHAEISAECDVGKAGKSEQLKVHGPGG